MTHSHPSIDFSCDPDHPNVVTLNPHSTKQERTGGAILDIVQSTVVCIRSMFAKYLVDASPDGAYTSKILLVFIELHLP